MRGIGTRCFCIQLEASCLQLSVVAYKCVCVCVFGAFFLAIEACLLTIEAFCLPWEYVRLLSTSTDCKQRSSTVGKEAPTESRAASLFVKLALQSESGGCVSWAPERVMFKHVTL